MPMSTKERARIAGLAAQARRTPEQRRETMRKVRLTAAVKAIAESAPDLTPEQVAVLRAIFAPAVAAR